MAGFTSIFADLLGALNQSFRLASFFPAMLFVLATSALAEQYLGDTALYRAIQSSFFGGVFLTVSLSLVVSYPLSILNVPLTQLYEGYTFRRYWLGRKLTVFNIRRKQWLEQEMQRLRQTAIDHRNAANRRKAELTASLVISPWDDAVFRREHEARFQALADLSAVGEEFYTYFPLDEKYILPTRLGNVFASFEDYPRHRYQMEAVPLWPRLLPTLVKAGYYDIIERQKMGYDFFLNLSFLSMVFALVYFAARLYFDAHVALALPLASIGLAWIFYRLAILAAIGYGVNVRVAFDLYRSQFREAMGLTPPAKFEDERAIWKQFSDFVRTQSLSESIFHYAKPVAKSKQESGPGSG